MTKVAPECPYHERIFSDGYWKCRLPAGMHVTHWLVWVRKEHECTTC